MQDKLKKKNRHYIVKIYIKIMNIKKYMKSHYRIEDFGRGKSKVSKARHRRIIKKKSLKELFKDLKDL